MPEPTPGSISHDPVSPGPPPAPAPLDRPELLALLRADLPDLGAHLVFFQHDEVVVHTPVDRAPEVAAAVEAAGERTRRLLFGDTPVRFPLGVSVVDCYADAK